MKADHDPGEVSEHGLYCSQSESGKHPEKGCMESPLYEMLPLSPQEEREGLPGTTQRASAVTLWGLGHPEEMGAPNMEGGRDGEWVSLMVK